MKNQYLSALIMSYKRKIEINFEGSAAENVKYWIKNAFGENVLRPKKSLRYTELQRNRKPFSRKFSRLSLLLKKPYEENCQKKKNKHVPTHRLDLKRNKTVLPIQCCRSVETYRFEDVFPR